MQFSVGFDFNYPLIWGRKVKILAKNFGDHPTKMTEKFEKVDPPPPPLPYWGVILK